MKQYEFPVTQPAFRLKGGTFAATVLELVSVAPEALSRQLEQKVAQAPQLLRHSPVIIALDKLDEADGPLDLGGLLDICRNRELQPVAVRAARTDDIVQAAALGIAVLPAARRQESAPPAAETAARARVVTQPVRGGQQVYAEGDLILLAPVSAGAEVMAGGHIHCYAALRGRALAGVQGDTSARVFCRELAAELVAIAGHYRVADDLKADPLWGRAVQISLREGQLLLAPL